MCGLVPLLHPGISSLDGNHCGHQLPDGQVNGKGIHPEQQEQADRYRCRECADPRIFQVFQFLFPRESSTPLLR